MASEWTSKRLKAMPLHERAELYRNACRLGHTPEGAALKTLIEEAGLPYSEEKCLTNDDPITIKMHQAINSKEGRLSAITATKAGLPAMAGIDPMLQVALGPDYGPHKMGTATAGGLVAELMHSLGYKNAGQRILPAHCAAGTAEFWI